MRGHRVGYITTPENDDRVARRIAAHLLHIGGIQCDYVFDISSNLRLSERGYVGFRKYETDPFKEKVEKCLRGLVENKYFHSDGPGWARLTLH